MTTYSEFEEIFLVAAYALIERTGKEIVDVGHVIDEYRLEPKPNWVRRALQSLSDSGYSKGRMTFGDERDQPVYLSPSGVRRAERLLEDGVVSVVQPDGVQSETPPSAGELYTTSLPADFVLSSEKREILTDELQKIELSLEDLPLSNSNKAQVRALVLAAKELSQAPEPPSDLIWEILNRANSVAGVLSLFVSVLSLFV